MTLTRSPADDPILPDLPAALPVAVDVRGQLTDVVRRTVEGALGWQPVDAATADLVPPAVRLLDLTSVRTDPTPAVLLVTADDPAPDAARAALRLRPDAIVAWPAGDDDLVDAVARATAAPRTATARTATVRVGGSSGGVGATTVTLALAGLAAWRGSATLVTSGDALLLPPGTPTIDPAALAAPDLYRRAADVPGALGLRAVRTTSVPIDVDVVDPDVEVAVIDTGVADEVDVLVIRPDAAGVAALHRSAAAAIVVGGDGPVAARALADAIGGRRRIDLPRSSRVARAAVLGRVPSGLPGRFVRTLAPLVPSGPSG